MKEIRTKVCKKAKDFALHEQGGEGMEDHDMLLIIIIILDILTLVIAGILFALFG